MGWVECLALMLSLIRRGRRVRVCPGRYRQAFPAGLPWPWRVPLGRSRVAPQAMPLGRPPVTRLSMRMRMTRAPVSAGLKPRRAGLLSRMQQGKAAHEGEEAENRPLQGRGSWLGASLLLRLGPAVLRQMGAKGAKSMLVWHREGQKNPRPRCHRDAGPDAWMGRSPLRATAQDGLNNASNPCSNCRGVGGQPLMTMSTGMTDDTPPVIA